MTSATTTDQMFYIPAHPFLWLTTIAVALVALWGRACGGWQHLSAAWQAASVRSARCYLRLVPWR